NQLWLLVGAAAQTGQMEDAAAAAQLETVPGPGVTAEQRNVAVARANGKILCAAAIQVAPVEGADIANIVYLPDRLPQRHIKVDELPGAGGQQERIVSPFNQGQPVFLQRPLPELLPLPVERMQGVAVADQHRGALFVYAPGQGEEAPGGRRFVIDRQE